MNLLAEPGILSAFFSKHSNHKLVLLKNVFEYLERVGKEEIVSHDVVAIDINLDRNVDYSRALPSDMDELDKPTFHRKAGFYIYNHLIRKGIPPENICLLTGEQGSTVEFNTHCRDSLIPRPTAFEKTLGEFDIVKIYDNQYSPTDNKIILFTHSNGAIRMDAIEPSIPTGIKSTEHNFSVLLQNKSIYVITPSNEKTTFELFDQESKLRKRIPQNTWMSVSDLASGIYYIRKVDVGIVKLKSW